jgi:hypothetical protein
MGALVVLVVVFGGAWLLDLRDARLRPVGLGRRSLVLRAVSR